MLNPFKQLQLVKAEVFTSAPGSLWLAAIFPANFPVAGRKMFAHP